MKHECEVVRDLMPLYLDGAASESSVRMLRTHLAECPECATMLAEMQQKPAALDAGAEDFSAAVRKLRRRKRLRTLLIGLFAVLTAGLLLALACVAAMYLRGMNVDVPTEAVEITLSRRSNGDIIINRKQHVPYEVEQQLRGQPEKAIRLSFTRRVLPDMRHEEELVSSERMHRMLWVEGEGLYRVEYAAVDHGLQVRGMGDAFFAETESRLTAVEELWYGDTLLYRRGDDIPLASEGLEAFMEIYDQKYGTGRERYAVISPRSFVTIPVDDQLRHANYMLAPSVPEWQ